MTVDAKAARGQNRTTQTDWSRVAPYIRFRYERAKERLPVEGTVYELGCGIGVGLNHIATSRPDLSFVGFDNSPEAIDFGGQHFHTTPNLRLIHAPNLEAVVESVQPGGFLIACEVIEHLTDAELLFFKTNVIAKFSGAVFSFPYDQKDIAGTNHLQSIDIYTIFELFPGFETIFIRRGSIKFIGYWKRKARPYVGESIGVSGENKAIASISNWL